MHKRFVTLDADERATLQAGRHHHPQHQFRARCQCLLLSADGQDVAALMAVLDVSRLTVYAWFTRWATGGLAGLANAAGQGRPPVLTEADRHVVQAAVGANRQQLKDVTGVLRRELDREFSPKTLKRFLKSLVAPGGGSVTT